MFNAMELRRAGCLLFGSVGFSLRQRKNTPLRTILGAHTLAFFTTLHFPQ
jgi:hypothetical protein